MGVLGLRYVGHALLEILIYQGSMTYDAELFMDQNTSCGGTLNH